MVAHNRNLGGHTCPPPLPPRPPSRTDFLHISNDTIIASMSNVLCSVRVKGRAIDAAAAAGTPKTLTDPNCSFAPLPGVLEDLGALSERYMRTPHSDGCT